MVSFINGKNNIQTYLACLLTLITICATLGSKNYNKALVISGNVSHHCEGEAERGEKLGVDKVSFLLPFIGLMFVKSLKFVHMMYTHVEMLT